MAESDVKVKFTGDASGAQEAMAQAVSSMKGALSEIKESVEGINKQFETISKGFSMVSTALAGGAAFKEFINSANEVTSESIAMSKALGVGVTQASEFRSALNSAGVSQDSVAMAGKRLSMQLLSGGQAIKDLGVATRDSNGDLRDSESIMLDVNEKLKEFKTGTDRNVEGMKVYGRAWQEIAPMVDKVTKESLEEAAEKADALNLTVSQESVDAFKAYKKSIREVGEVFEGINRTVGEVFIPRLTSLAEWFATIGPTAVSVMRGVMTGYMAVQDAVKDSVVALWNLVVEGFEGIGAAITAVFGEAGTGISAMEVFRNVIRLIQIAFIGFRVGIELACEAVSGYVKAVMSNLRQLADVAVAALHLDWAGVKDAWAEGTARTEKVFADSMQRMVDIARKGQSDIEAAALNDPTAKGKSTRAEKSSGGKNAIGVGGGAPLENQVAEWKAALQARNEDEQHYFKESLQADLEYWQGKLTLIKGNSKVEIAERRAVNTEIFNIHKQLATQDRAIEEEKLDGAQKVQLADIALQKQNATSLSALGQISKEEELARLKELAEKEYQINMQRLEAKKKLLDYDRVQQQKLSDEMVQLTMKRNLEVQKLDSDILQAQQKQINDMLAPITSAIDSSIKGIIAGTQTLKGALASLFQSILLEFVNNFVKMMVAEWAKGETAKLLMSQMGAAKLKVLQALGLSDAVVATKAAAAGTIPAEAAMAAGGAAQAVAGIPIVGPAMAATAYAETMGMVMGGLSVASAKGGFDIPAGMNPLVQMHEKEMVLPQQQADAIRSIAANGGSAGAVNLHVHATDAQSVARLFRDNGKHIVTALQQQRRNMAF